MNWKFQPAKKDKYSRQHIGSITCKNWCLLNPGTNWSLLLSEHVWKTLFLKSLSQEVQTLVTNIASWTHLCDWHICFVSWFVSHVFVYSYSISHSLRFSILLAHFSPEISEQHSELIEKHGLIFDDKFKAWDHIGETSVSEWESSMLCIGLILSGH